MAAMIKFYMRTLTAGAVTILPCVLKHDDSSLENDLSSLKLVTCVCDRSAVDEQVLLQGGNPSQVPYSMRPATLPSGNMMNFVLTKMNFVLKMMSFAFKMLIFVFKLKLMPFAIFPLRSTCRAIDRSKISLMIQSQGSGKRSSLTSAVRSTVSNNDEFCFKNEELCIKNDEFCIKTDELCRPFDHRSDP